MKKIRMMILEDCPHCKRAFAIIDEIRQNEDAFNDLEIEVIDEQKHPEIADNLDYWYVPTFYVDGEKLMEGVPSKEKIEAVFHKAIQ